MPGEYTPTGDDVPIQNARWTRQITFVDALTGDGLNLAGLTYKMQIRRDPAATTALLTLTTGNGIFIIDAANGVISIDIAADVMGGLPVSTPQGWYYDLLEIPNGDLTQATKPLFGRFPVLAGVTR